ncbi:disulfide bond formation protein B [Aliidiomarina minuta]|uniref:disulfide bond formation protein B n=1 Tax=Aliidiomarina minuta TaxID=880057 RepID=UPI0013002E47|nr:disulfide bond formation protein B [Aliidiomarina minuta]
MTFRDFLTSITVRIAKWPSQRLPWLLLALSSTALIVVALYTQYGPQQLIPCVQCIYQRTAMIALTLFAWLGVTAPHYRMVRWLAIVGWIISSAVGWYAANHHVWLQEAANPLFQPCSPYPDFPTWLPLHDWMPWLFGAGGLCGDIDWQFAGLSMPEWLRIIFATYLAIALVVALCRMAHHPNR